MHNKVREPLFHIVKRDTLPWYQAWGIRAVAIVLALLLCALITTLCTHLNPIKVFGTMFGGAFGAFRTANRRAARPPVACAVRRFLR